MLLKNTRLTKRLLINFTSPVRKLRILNGVKGLMFLVKIEGESAWPDLISGKSYLATNLLRPKIGDFIVFKRPRNQYEIIVKRVKEIRRGGYFLEGTLPWAESSKDFGLVNKKLILGKIIK